MQIVVIGGGAAGFFGAITAAETFPQTRVIILEKSRNVLSKVRVSGGGRCNVTHACFDNRKLAKNYPRGEAFLRPLLKHFDADATVRWFESRGVALKTEADGRMFPVTDSSETIIDCLLREARRLRIDIRTSCGVTDVQAETSGWRLHLSTNETLHADRLLIAVGGYPQAPSYAWIPGVGGKSESVKERKSELMRVGVSEGETIVMDTSALVPPVPSLFTFNTPQNPLLELAGVSVPDALVKIADSRVGNVKHEYRGPVLITHWGFSGPAVLKLSAWGARDLAGVQYVFTFRINWLPGLNENQIREQFQVFRQQHPKKAVVSQGLFSLPNRLWAALAQNAGIAPDVRWADLPGKAQNRLINLLTNSEQSASGKTTFKEEFVTCGGISLDAIHPETLESRTCPGLFFAGEVLDVDGITGGFNFQNAWTTGFVAGKNLGL